MQLHICVTCTNNWFVVVLWLNKSKGFDIIRHKTMMNDEMKNAIENIKTACTEENLWQAIIIFQNYPFYTASGLPFHYTLKTGRNGELTRELWVNRRENSKSLSWSSVALAFERTKQTSEEIPGPKKLGNIRGISYIYAIFWTFGLIKVPASIAEKMQGHSDQSSDHSGSRLLT